MVTSRVRCGQDLVVAPDPGKGQTTGATGAASVLVRYNPAAPSLTFTADCGSSKILRSTKRIAPLQAVQRLRSP